MKENNVRRAKVVQRNNRVLDFFWDGQCKVPQHIPKRFNWVKVRYMMANLSQFEPDESWHCNPEIYGHGYVF